MADVIFAGTPGRPPLGRAEVQLTIDNSDGALPLDYTEVTIGRLMYRSGESEYSVNGSPCRLLDVQELLSDSGIGRELHVVVGQGQLDAVLGARPEDRRAFVEEAAGVLKHRKRKEKALRKLETMTGNLARVSDLAGELRRQLGPLARQAEAARKASLISARLRDARLRAARRRHRGGPGPGRGRQPVRCPAARPARDRRGRSGRGALPGRGRRSQADGVGGSPGRHAGGHGPAGRVAGAPGRDVVAGPRARDAPGCRGARATGARPRGGGGGGGPGPGGRASADRAGRRRAGPAGRARQGSGAGGGGAARRGGRAGPPNEGSRRPAGGPGHPRRAARRRTGPGAGPRRGSREAGRRRRVGAAACRGGR